MMAIYYVIMYLIMFFGMIVAEEHTKGNMNFEKFCKILFLSLVWPLTLIGVAAVMLGRKLR